MLSQLLGGTFKFVLHCSCANVAGVETADHLTTAVDFTALLDEADNVSFIG